MDSFLGEIKRRKVFQVAAVYAVVAWLLIQIAATVEEPLGLPVWFDTAVIVLLGIGFPIALVLTWAFDLTPGHPGAALATADGRSNGSARSQSLNYLMHSLVLIAVGFLLVDQYVFERSRTPVLTDGGSSVSNNAGMPKIKRFAINLGATEQIGNTGLEAHIAISPGGDYIAYSIIRDNIPRLFLRPLDQLNSQLLDGPVGAYHPFFSPNSEWIAYYDDVYDLELEKISIRGGPAQRLTSARWSGGGSWQSDDTIVFSTQDTAIERSIFAVDAGGGDRMDLLHSDGNFGYVWPDVLPDQKGILFVARPIGRATSDGWVGLLEAGSSTPKTLLSSAYRPRYVPTGHIVFVRGSTLSAVPFDLERLEVTGNEVPVVAGIQSDPTIGAAAYAFSNDGTLIYLPGTEVRGGLSQPVSVTRNQTETLFPLEPRIYNDLKLAPDGEHLALVITETGNADVFIFDQVDQSLNQITFNPELESDPVWRPLPDGEFVFGSGHDGNGIYLASVDSTQEPVRLTESAYRQRPRSFSPDGSLLVYSQDGPDGADLYVLSLVDGSQPEPLLVTDAHETDGQVSPDGNWLAYASFETGRSEVFVRPFPETATGRQWKISMDGGVRPQWSQDTNELFFVGPDSQSIMSVTVQTSGTFSHGPPRELFRGPYAINALADFDVTPDGQTFLMLKQLRAGGAQVDDTELIVVENWFEDLKRLAPSREQSDQ